MSYDIYEILDSKLLVSILESLLKNFSLQQYNMCGMKKLYTVEGNYVHVS